MEKKDHREKLIAFCGLYCGDCCAHKGTIADLAAELSAELDREHFARMAESLSRAVHFKAFERYEDCRQALDAMTKIRCGKTCRGGGGRPDCAIRACCREKGFEGCWQCGGFETCPTLDSLCIAHGDAHIRNLRQIQLHGAKAFADGEHLWYCEGKG
ncbi:MAG: DUF3795 domain-containing protein [Phycisphaerales bacterium]